jgi:hypothetical protein
VFSQSGNLPYVANWLVEFWCPCYDTNNTAANATIRLQVDGGSVWDVDIPLVNTQVRWNPFSHKRVFYLGAGAHTFQVWAITQNGMCWLKTYPATSKITGSTLPPMFLRVTPN